MLDVGLHECDLQNNVTCWTIRKLYVIMYSVIFVFLLALSLQLFINARMNRLLLRWLSTLFLITGSNETKFHKQLRFFILHNYYVEINQQNALNYILPALLSYIMMFFLIKVFYTVTIFAYIYCIILLYLDLSPTILKLSGSERNIIAPWGWHCFAETCRSHRNKK